ncbi:MAG: ABC transporter permease, partial [Thermoactinospora sp.]|nr:ABC transporter permease [Thermoactinospora sp.]
MRPVIRWTLRLLRREWRAQLLVLSLLTVAVTVGVGGTAAVYSLEPVGHAGEFGTANLAFRFGGADQAELGRSLETIRSGYGRAEVIGRRQVLLRGGARLIEFRSQDPAGPYGRPMLALREGRYPAGGDEVAVTEEIARILDLAPGSRFTLDQNEWTVVGLVENPSNLRDAFVLVAPARAGQPTTVTVLARGDPDAGLVALENFNVAIADLDPGEDQLMAAVVALVGGSLALLLVALVAAAGFAVVGRRRQRQLGMLAAIGATQRQLRLAMVA